MKTALPSLLIFAAVSPMASAGTKTYDGGVGGTGTAIEVTTNWSPDGLPITSDEVLLDNSIITLPSVLTITGSGTGVTYGDLLVNSNTLTNLSILSGTTSRLITLSNGGGSTAAVAAGGAAGDILLLGTNVTGTVTIGNNAAASTGRVNLALGADGNFNVVNSTATANLTGVLSGAFNLTKTGAGTLTLSGVNTWGAAKTFTLSAGTLNLNSTTALGSATNTFKISGGTTIDNTSGAAITLGNNQPMTIDGDFTFTGGSGTTHDLNLGTGAKTLGTSVGTSRTITTSAGTLTIGGIIGNGATANSIIKTGAGTLTLTGANTFSGGVTIKQGTVSATTNASALGGTGAGGVTLGDSVVGLGATLNIDGRTFANAITLGSGSTGTLSIGNSATASIFSGGVSGSNGFTINNSGAAASTLTLSTANIASTGLITSTGTSTGATTISSSITSANTVGVTQNSSGSLVLSGTSNAYSGTTTLTTGTLQGTTSAFSAMPTSPFGTSALALNAGILQLRTPGVTGATTIGTTTAETVTFGNNVTVGGTTTINVDRTAGFTVSTTKTLAMGTLVIGANTLNVTGGNTYGLSFGATTASGAANFSPTTAPLTLASLTLANSIATGTTTVETLDGTATTNTITGTISNNSVDVTKVLALTKSNSGTWTLAGANTYTGATTISGGTLSLTGSLNGSNVSTSGSAIINESAAGVISGTGTTFTQGSTGTSILAGTNTYTGATTLSDGSLSIGATENIGDAASNLVFDGGTLRITGTTLISVTGIGHTVVTNTGKTVGLDINTAANTFTFDQVLNQGTGGLTKLGTGAMVLNQANTYSGSTNINAGVLQISASNNLGDGSATNVIAMAGGKLQSTGGSYDLGVNRTVSLGASSTIQIDAGALTVSGDITSTASSTLTFITAPSGSSSLLISGNITDGAGGKVTSLGFGTFSNGYGIGNAEITGNNSYSGQTFVDFEQAKAGTLTTSGTNSSLIGTTFVQGGNLNLNNASNGGLAGGLVTLFVGNLKASTAATLSNTILNTNNFGVFGSQNIIFNGDFTAGAASGRGIANTMTGGATLTFNGSYLNLGTSVATTNIFSLTGSGNTVINSLIQDYSGGVGTTGASLTMGGSGTGLITLTNNANSYTGSTAVTGNVAATVAHAFGDTSGISVSGTGTLSLRGDASTNFTKLTGGALYGVTATANNATINVDQGTVAGTGPKTMGIGSLTLNTANANSTNFTGSNNTSLSVGAVFTGTGVSGTETINNSITGGGSLTLASIAVNRTSAAQTLAFTGNGDTAVTGVISQPGGAIISLTKGGTGVLTLAGTNTYAGNTTISAGSLSLGNGGTTGSLATTGTITNNANLTINRSNAVSQGTDFSGTAIGGSGSFTQAGGGNTTLTAINTYAGTTTVSGGKLTIDSTGTINSTSGISIGAGEFNYNSTTALSKSVSFSGTGGTLSGTGTITPAVTVTSGNRQTAGSSVTAANPTTTLGKETFSTGISYATGSIFEWNLTGNTETSIGTRGTDYDAVNTASLGATSGSIFRVILNGSQNFGETFWDTDRTWAGIFKNLAETSAYDLSTVFNGGFQYQNSTGTVAGVTSAQGAFSFTNSGADLRWTSFTAVPEPTSALAGVLLTAGLLRRRRV